MSIFNTQTIDELTELTLRYSPSGRVWRNKVNPLSNLYKFFRGFSSSQSQYVEVLNNIFDAKFPRNSTLEIERHERDLAIPDTIFNREGNISDRQKDVIVKRYLMREDTAENFKAIAAVYGVQIEIRRLRNSAIFPLAFPIGFSPDESTARYTLLITFIGDFNNVFPLPFPVPFAPSTAIEKLKRIYNSIKPITTQIIYRN